MNIKILESLALSVRTLSMDSIERAASGHPGMPMGMAELGALLFGDVMNFNPDNKNWVNRDRLVLSAGHGSMWLYSLLHLSGYNITLDDLKNFRQIGSKTPGHPEYNHTDGVEVTTGPLGAGIANAVGFAIAQQILSDRFNTPSHKIIDHYCYVVAGDGCLMEGVSGEASSLAGHLGLDRLIMFYDSNQISIEGSTDLAFTEDVALRYKAYGWNVLRCSAYDFNTMSRHITDANKNIGSPSLIILDSIIAKGAPTKEGSHHSHGSPLGAVELKKFRIAHGIADDLEFFVSRDVVSYMSKRKAFLADTEAKWHIMFDEWANNNPTLKKEWDSLYQDSSLILSQTMMPTYHRGDKIATRVAGGKALNALCQQSTAIIGGSADLSPSNNTIIIGGGDIQKNQFKGRNIHFGVREHAMGNIINGINIYGPFISFGSTFMVFSDYMRASIRLAAIMQVPTIFVFTHDSIFVGEDGPTHEPVEQLESLRLIPSLTVLRPADAVETNWAWMKAVSSRSSPTVIALSRQNIEVFSKPDDWELKADQGGYPIIGIEYPEVIIFATGSEVTMALDAILLSSKAVEVISVTNLTQLLNNTPYLNKIAPPSIRRIAVEAGVGNSWYRLTNEVLSINQFGYSGKADDIAKILGMTAQNLANML